MKNFYRILLAASLVAASLAAPAEDIDLFMGYPPGTKELPNVMIVLDNAANFSSNDPSAGAAQSTCTIDGQTNTLTGTVGGIEQCALYKVISDIPTSDPNDASVTATVNIGMMVYNATNIRDVNNANCGGTVGGCLAQPLITLNAANKTALLAWIKSWNTTGGAGNGYIKANSEADGAAMQETWAYFAGRTGLSGRNYSGIKPPSACNKSYIIFVGNSYSKSGTPGDQTGNNGPKNALEGTNSTSSMNASPAATTDQKALITSTIKTTCQNNAAFTFPSSAHENKGYYADEWARYLSAHSVTTYSIGVLGDGCQAEYAALLTSMADLGGGKYFPTTDYTGLVLAFQTILSEIQSVNSVFASVSLPAAVNTQGTYLNQVYIGMFRPDKDGLPRWPGNLKQYRLGVLNGTLQLLDAHTTLTSAISSNNTGFIAECALSYWTPTIDDSYWAWNSTQNCIGHPASSNTPDGNFVEKGGQGYVLRGSKTATSIARNIQTCDGSCSALTVFDTSNGAISKAALGDSSMTDAARTDLINWARGLNNNVDETFAAATAMRPSVHGDVVHSRPVALNFPSLGGVVVFYGGNDGVLRAVNGSRTTAITSGANTYPAGSELWSFLAPEFYGSIKRLRDNTTPISFKGSTFTGALPKSYGVDGPITANQDATHAWIY
ncbi:MAG TPA: hypothetical protein VEP71_04490, partial [Gallionella sp.]|nr:hypothetical protein [Gallionella sp.]